MASDSASSTVNLTQPILTASHSLGPDRAAPRWQPSGTYNVLLDPPQLPFAKFQFYYRPRGKSRIETVRPVPYIFRIYPSPSRDSHGRRHHSSYHPSPYKPSPERILHVRTRRTKASFAYPRSKEREEDETGHANRQSNFPCFHTSLANAV